MAVGSLQELIVDSNWLVGDGYKGEATWGTRNGTERWGKLMVVEDGFTVDITNQTLQTEYKHGTLDPAEIRRIGMEVAGSCNVQFFPDFARLLLDMCAFRETDGESRSFTMLFNSPLGGTEDYGGGHVRETRYLLGTKVNTFTLAASNDSQELMCNTEMIGKSCHYTHADWTRDKWLPKNPYIFIDGDVFFRPYDVVNITSPLSPFSPWSPTPSEWNNATVSGFSIEGNNNLTPGPYKRDGMIQSLKAGRLQLNGSFTLDYENSGIDWYMLENFSHGELVLNFQCPGQTGYEIDKSTFTIGGNTCDFVTGADSANFLQYDVVLIIGTINNVTVSEVFLVEGISSPTIGFYTFGDWPLGANQGRLPFSPGFGFRHDWTQADANPKIYNYAMQVWIPTFKISDTPKTGAPTETQVRAVNFQVDQPDVADEDTDWSASFNQIQYLAPSGLNPADRTAPESNYFIVSGSIDLTESQLDDTT